VHLSDKGIIPLRRLLILIDDLLQGFLALMEYLVASLQVKVRLTRHGLSMLDSELVLHSPKVVS
jgi:hypothetical protein